MPDEQCAYAAVIFGEKKFSYSEADKVSNDIAAFLLSKNISVGDVALILIPRCAFMLIAALGALKAGCTYQPLDSTYPPERLNFMVKDAAAKVLTYLRENSPASIGGGMNRALTTGIFLLK